MNKNFYCLAIAFLLFPLFSQAQYFRAFADYQGNDIVFYLQPNPGGGDITTGWSDIEFFLRYPTSAPVFSYGATTVNSTNFPGISMPYNGDDVQGSEMGYTNSWFGTSYSPTTNQTYTDGQVYEVFRVTLNIDPSTVNFELVHNAFFFPTYLALVSHVGGDMSSTGGVNKFYGSSENCVCPAPSNNDRLVLGGALPVELHYFTAKGIDNKTVQLDWVTEQEKNNLGFEIQRMNQDAHWETIGFEEGHGDSNIDQSYVYYDRHPYLNTTNYYRLKQLDVDGTYEYSAVKSVVFQIEEKGYRIYPNPTSDEFHLDRMFSGAILIRNVLGQVFLRRENVTELQSVNIGHLPVGQYFVELIGTNNQWQTETLLIQR